jgi:hypothetical protein
VTLASQDDGGTIDHTRHGITGFIFARQFGVIRASACPAHPSAIFEAIGTALGHAADAVAAEVTKTDWWITPIGTWVSAAFGVAIGFVHKLARGIARLCAEMECLQPGGDCCSEEQQTGSRKQSFVLHHQERMGK